MKKLAISFLALAAGVMSAMAVDSANTFVTVKVNSSTTNTVIAVPLVDIGAGNEPVNITNFVLTAGLEDGATLTVKYSSDGKWYTFVNESGTWTAGVSVDTSSVVTTPSGAETIARGGAAMLHNEFTGASFDFCLYGQLATSSTTVTPVANATSAIANGSLSDCLVSSISGVEGDFIKTPKDDGEGMNTYKYGDGKWKTRSGVEVTSSDVIPVGKGFWYVSKSSTVPTITWAAQE